MWRTGIQVRSWPLKKICKTFSVISTIHLIVRKAGSEQNWWITFPGSLLSKKVVCQARFFFLEIFFTRKYQLKKNQKTCKKILMDCHYFLWVAANSPFLPNSANLEYYSNNSKNCHCIYCCIFAQFWSLLNFVTYPWRTFVEN